MDTSTQSLLVELFVEELPPKALKKLGEAFASVLLEQLKAQGLTTDVSKLTAFASPRRLAAHVTAIAAQAVDRSVSQKLMPASVGLDAAGRPTPALLKKLQALGADASAVPALMRAMDGKAEALFYHSTAKGATLAEGVQKALDEAIAKLPIPKVMTYQLADGWSDVKFVRPAHSLVALHGSDVVPVQALGLKAGNTTGGHRFEAAVDPVRIASADSYAATLEQDGAVIASFEARRAEIVRQLAAAAAKVGGGAKAIEDPALLDEVTGLVERPNVLTCQFESEFLEVPQECLILTMKANQKYFPVLDSQDKLTNRFLVVSNIRPDDASAVIQGNERVVRPRLADAKFFFDQDRKRTLESRVPQLARVVYHNKLGTQGDRTERVRAIAKWVAQRLGADPQLADRAAMLAKADLVTDMVGEFPELQGIMGGYYARHDGENEQLAQAIADQYVLKRDDTSDGSNRVSAALVLADRAETLVGIWGIGLKPTGEKDPFALRRHALTIIRTFELLGAGAAICGNEFGLRLDDLLNKAASSFAAGMVDSKVVDEVRHFIYDRYSNQLAPLFGTGAVEAVIVQQPPLQEVVRRLEAVREFEKLPEAPALAAANKRISNILKKAENADAHVNAALLREPAEQALHAAMKDITPRAAAQFDLGDYTMSLQTLAALRAPVDAFFDGVMVNAEEADLRLNRLGLLATLHLAMNRVADLSRLAA
ncbi:MAG: glycine--tRNA ligase subunit beta [Ramlibacter sp.]